MSNKTEIVISAVDRISETLARITSRIESATAPAKKLAGLVSGFSKATGFNEVIGGVNAVKGAMSSTAMRVASVAGTLSAAAAGMAHFALSAANAADNIGDLSEKFQIDSEMLQVYGDFVQEDGGSIEGAAASIGKLKKSMNEALHGGKEQAAAFAGVGISLAQLKKMKPDEVMRRMADAFKGSEKDAAKQAVLLELMGKGGETMMGAMNRGGEAYQKKLEEMRADGRIFSREQLESANDFTNAWQRVSGVFEGLKNMLGIALADKLMPFIDMAREWAVANRDLIASRFSEFLDELPGYIETAIDVMKSLWHVLRDVFQVFSVLSGLIGASSAVFIALATAFAPLIASVGSLFLSVGKMVWVVAEFTGILPLLGGALKALWAVLAANPFVLVAAALAGLAVIVYKNWDSIVAYIRQAWENIKSAFDTGFLNGLIQVFMETFDAIGNGIVGLLKSIPLIGDIPFIKNLEKVTLASDRAAALRAGGGGAEKAPLTVSEAAQMQRQEFDGKLNIHIDAEGRPKVTDLSKSGNSGMEIDVNAGLALAGY